MPDDREKQWLTILECGNEFDIAKAAIQYQITKGAVEIKVIDGVKHVSRGTAAALWGNKYVAPLEGDVEEERAPLSPTSTKVESEQYEAYWKARQREIQVKKAEGALVDIDEIKTRFFDVGRRVRDALQQLPSRLAAEMAAETDVHVTEMRWREEIDSALERFTDSMIGKEEDEE